jgi:hypothetical protein
VDALVDDMRRLEKGLGDDHNLVILGDASGLPRAANHARADSP